MNKKTKIILSVSIILNILFIGLLVGHFSHRISMLYSMKSDMQETIKSLPQDKQDLVFSTIKELKSESGEAKDKIKIAQADILKTLTAPEFNPELFDKQVQELHMTFGELTADLAGAVKELALNLDQDERKKLAELIEKGHRMRRSGDSKWRHDWNNDFKQLQEEGSVK